MGDWDIKQHNVTGDWLFSANLDFEETTGEGLIAQRIRNRLKIEQGTVINFPSLGSRLRDLLRASIKFPMAGGEIEALIREALLPMVDIVVNDVTVERSETDPSKLEAQISYSPTLVPDDGFVPDAELQEFSVTMAVDEILEPAGEEATT